MNLFHKFFNQVSHNHVCFTIIAVIFFYLKVVMSYDGGGSQPGKYFSEDFSGHLYLGGESRSTKEVNTNAFDGSVSCIISVLNVSRLLKSFVFNDKSLLLLDSSPSECIDILFLVNDIVNSKTTRKAID